MSLTRRSLLASGAALSSATILSGRASATGIESSVSTPWASPVGGSMVVYSGRGEGLVGPLLDATRDAIGVDIEVRYGNTAELAATILEEGDNSPADVFFSQDAGALGALAKAELLARLPDDLLGKVDPKFQSTDGQWIGVSGRARVLAYNIDSVDASALPASVEALADPAWSGKIGWAPTNASFQTFVTAFRLLKGEDSAKEWLEAMQSNGTVTFEGNADVVRAVAANEIDAGLVNHYYKYEIEKEEGAELPVENHFFAAGDVGSLVNVAGVGMLASAEHTAQAEAFVSYLLSADAQQYFAAETAEYPLAAGVEPAFDLQPLDQIQPPDIDLNHLDDLEGTLELLTEIGLI